MVGEEELSSELLLFSGVVVTIELLYLFMYSLRFLMRFQNAQGCK